MQLQDLNAFVAVAADRSFSKAAKRLHRTQPAISQAIRRLEDELGDKLFDRSSRNGALTEAGVLLREHAARLLRLASEAEAAVRELQQVRRGRVVVGANEAAVHAILPIIERFARLHPQARVEVRRVASRQIAHGAARAQPRLRRPDVPAARQGAAVDLARQRRARDARQPEAPARVEEARHASRKSGARPSSRTTIPSPARDRVLRLYERRHAPINIQIALPSLDGIKRAVEMGLGVAVLPRRCALTEIARGHLVAVKVPELSSPRSVRFVFRKSGELSRAAAAFLELARAGTDGTEATDKAQQEKRRNGEGTNPKF